MALEGDSPLDARAEIDTWRSRCATDVSSSIRRRRGSAEKIQAVSGDFRRAYFESGVVADSGFVQRAFLSRSADLRVTRATDIGRERVDVSLVPVEISIVRVRSRIGSGYVEPLRARALMDSSGRLSVVPETRSGPVPPIWFTSNAFFQDADFGDCDEYATFVAERFRRSGVWPDSWVGCVEFFEESARAAARRAAGDFFATLMASGRGLCAGWIQVARVGSLTSPSASMLDVLRDDEGTLASHDLSLLRRFAQGEGERALWDREGFSDYVGHPSATVPLGDGQRVAVACESFLADGELLGVVGGPGTGKTSLILPVAASAYVRAAMNNLEPPAIVAISGTFEDSADLAATVGRALSSGRDTPRVDGLDISWLELAVGSTLAAVSRDGYVDGCVLVSDADLREFDCAPAVALEHVLRDSEPGGFIRFCDVLLACSLPRFAEFWIDRARGAFGVEILGIPHGQEVIRDRLLGISRLIHGMESAVARMESRILSFCEYAPQATTSSPDFFARVAWELCVRVDAAERRIAEYERSGPAFREDARARERSVRLAEDLASAELRARTARDVEKARASAARRVGVVELEKRVDASRALFASLRSTLPSSGFVESFMFSAAGRGTAAAEFARVSGSEVDLHPIRWDVFSVAALIDSLGTRISEISVDLAAANAALDADRLEIEIVAARVIVERRASVTEARVERREAFALLDVVRRSEITDCYLERDQLRATRDASGVLARDMDAFRVEHGIPADRPPDWIRGKLDVGLRHDAFLLAARYWEGEFLRRAGSFVSSRPPGRREVLRTAACIFPIMVGRVADVCDLLRAPRSIGSSPLWGYADVMFVDDAGRQPVHSVAPIFALSRRALVVGDFQVSVVDSGDFPLVGRSDERSVLQWALSASRFWRYDGSAISLREQYTLPFELASIVANFWFDESPGAVATVRPRPPLPAYGRFPIADGNPSCVDDALVSWLVSNVPTLETAYAEEFPGTIVGVSCFERSRAESLTAALKRIDSRVSRRVSVVVSDRVSRLRYPVVLCVVERRTCYLDREVDIKRTDAMALGAIASVVDSFVLITVGEPDSDRVSALSRLVALRT